jgi:hypothetical protein
LITCPGFVIGARGVTGLEADDAGEDPDRLVAVTVKV